MEGRATHTAATRAPAVRPAAIALAVAGTVLWIPLLDTLLGRGGGFLADLGFLAGPRGTPAAWALALIVAVAYAGYTVKGIPLVRRYALEASALKLLAVAAAVAAAVVEEAFFRRLVMDQVRALGVPAAAQILASGLAFGLAHAAWGVAVKRVRIALRVMLATTTLGLALAAVYVIGDRSLAPVIVSHFIITATVQPGIMIAAFGGALGTPGGGAAGVER